MDAEDGHESQRHQAETFPPASHLLRLQHGTLCVLKRGSFRVNQWPENYNSVTLGYAQRDTGPHLCDYFFGLPSENLRWVRCMVAQKAVNCRPLYKFAIRKKS